MSPLDANKLNERDLQLAVYRYRERITPYPLIVTNIYLWGWESDALYITTRGYVHEFEIKLSHHDFLRDMNKYLRHHKIPNGSGPKYFYYVCPPGIISESEVPEYAGLGYVTIGHRYYREDPDQFLTLEIIRSAPRQKVLPLTDKQWREIASKAADKYWLYKKHFERYAEKSEGKCRQQQKG